MTAPMGPFRTRKEIESAVRGAFAEVEACLIVRSYENQGYGHEADDDPGGGAA